MKKVNIKDYKKDLVEFNYKLPLVAIKKLIRSYYEEIYMYDRENVYLSTHSSSGNRSRTYCYQILKRVRDQLDKYGLEGKKIDDEVFDRYFKDEYEKMERFQKNHGNKVMYDFKPCNDPKCCDPKDYTDKKLNNSQPEIESKKLKVILENFAHDLTNHVIQVKNDQVHLSAKRMKRLIKDYSELKRD